MDDEGRRELAERFDQYVVGDVDYLKRRGYNPAFFLGMIRRRGSAVTVAKLLLSSSRRTTYGFEWLWEMGELGHSIEFASLLPWFSALFTDDELNEARSRLILHDFPVDERLAKATASPPPWTVR